MGSPCGNFHQKRQLFVDLQVIITKTETTYIKHVIGPTRDAHQSNVGLKISEILQINEVKDTHRVPADFGLFLSFSQQRHVTTSE